MMLYGPTDTKFNFYPRPPRGGRQKIVVYDREAYKFLSTPSARRATGNSTSTTGAFTIFLSTPSARRATRRLPTPWAGRWNFYPRPPRGGRRTSGSGTQPPTEISIHALREEGDRGVLVHGAGNVGFLSTPSARRATSTPTCPAISPTQFLSTPSARRATGGGLHGRRNHPISIHALREEGDPWCSGSRRW